MTDEAKRVEEALHEVMTMLLNNPSLALADDGRAVRGFGAVCDVASKVYGVDRVSFMKESSRRYRPMNKKKKRKS